MIIQESRKKGPLWIHLGSRILDPGHPKIGCHPAREARQKSKIKIAVAPKSHNNYNNNNRQQAEPTLTRSGKRILRRSQIVDVDNFLCAVDKLAHKHSYQNVRVLEVLCAC